MSDKWDSSVTSRSMLTEVLQGIRNGNRAALARAITLLESSLEKDRALADGLLEGLAALQPPAQATCRIGLSGPPGAGKSTWIEHFGAFLLEQRSKERMAVLAIDPSSEKSGGTLLGDKTRMPALSNHPRCFIRPSPARGQLGGIARATRDTILLCEAAGYHNTIVETVGVGQSETLVADTTDILVMLIPPTAGDELQGLKKGIMDRADVIVIHKADGDLLPAAKRTAREYLSAVKLNPKGSTPVVCMVSSLEKKGFPELLKHLDDIRQERQANGSWYSTRKLQSEQWHYRQIQEELLRLIRTNMTLIQTAWQKSHPDLPFSSASPRSIASFMCERLK